ncbi:phospholipase A and acyltransferase 3-like [Macrotis lagotis]|uniref:phospholipase A and acyltransferase 3-like n=1 Tax=Macrotis lagotis TaxID=92651 RepID=UPI003D692ACF
MKPEPEPGDLIEIFRLCYNHWAVYVGDGYVVHLSSLKSKHFQIGSMSIGMNKCIVNKELLSEVVRNDEYRVNNKWDKQYNPRSPTDIVQRALKKVGKEISYEPTSKNCEHYVTDLRYGVALSDQVSINLPSGWLIRIFWNFAKIFGKIFS